MPDAGAAGSPLGAAGSATASQVGRGRAEDAGWAVAPEADGGGIHPDSEGLGGGQGGGRSGSLAGGGAEGSDGSGEGLGGGSVQGEQPAAADGASAMGDAADRSEAGMETMDVESAEEGVAEGQTTGAGSAETNGDAAADAAKAHAAPSGAAAAAANGQTVGADPRPQPPAREHAPPHADRTEEKSASQSPEQAEPLGAPPSDRPRRFSDIDLLPQPAPSRPDAIEPWQRAAMGTWKLVAVHEPARDFLPSGASERYIGIDPDARVLRAVLLWDGAASVSMAAEYEVGFRPEFVEIQPLPHAPSAFPATSTTLLGGGRFVPAASAPPCELRWSRQGNQLTIGGGVYQAVEPDDMIDVLNQPAPTEQAAGAFGQQSLDEGAAEAMATVDFFGVQAEGRYFCYIVDVSGSMGSNGGMLRLRTELEQSLASLPRGTRFAVLPFNHTLRDLQSSWTSANANKAQDIGRRLARVGAVGGTDPTAAFDWAFRKLNPRPDAIFFMTDGQMNNGQRLISQLATLNAATPRSRIHTIGLGGAADMWFLEQVADANGGTSRSVR